MEETKAEDPSATAAATAGLRVRHQSEFHAQKPSPSRYQPGSSARDDYDLRRQMSIEKLSGSSDIASSSVPDRMLPPEEEQQAREEDELSKLFKDQKERSPTKKPDPCSCWCSGWAEVIRKNQLAQKVNLIDLPVW